MSTSPTERTLAEDIAIAVADPTRSINRRRATADKRGRTPRLPYVPVIVNSPGEVREYREQIRGLAFATRTEAVEYAQRRIDAQRAQTARELAMPQCRALRESYGLPREPVELFPREKAAS